MTKITNSLLDKFPAVAEQWHTTKNDSNQSPGIVAAGSHEIVWWRCAAAHEWKEAVRSRVRSTAAWKRGDPAACPFCNPLGLDARIIHDYPCGHSAQVTRRNVEQNAERCWDCEQPYYEERQRQQRREKRQALREYKPQPATSAQRTAQKQIVGVLKTCAVLEPGVSLTFWREADCGDLKADAAELSQSLELLGVPHAVSLSKSRAPWQPETVARKVWMQLTVPIKDIESLSRWSPWLETQLSDSYNEQ